MRQIFYRFIGKVSAKMKLSKQQWKAVNAILLCRTPALGGEVKQCEDCGKTERKYRSCRNRHCPVCQAEQAHKWLEKEKKKLLPVSYFHVVFTFASELNEVFAYNKKLLYGLTFTLSQRMLRTSSQETPWNSRRLKLRKMPTSSNNQRNRSQPQPLSNMIGAHAHKIVHNFGNAL